MGDILRLTQRSALDGGQKDKTPSIRPLQHDIHEAKQHCKNVKICWVPEHAGIASLSVETDRKAKRASGGGNVIVEILYTDMFVIIAMAQ